MKANFDFNRLSESRKQELDHMVADFSEAGCLFVEDLFLEFLIDADNGIDRSDDKLVATFDDECGHELVFILSQEEVHYVIHAISEKLDNIVPFHQRNALLGQFDGAGGAAVCSPPA